MTDRTATAYSQNHRRLVPPEATKAQHISLGGTCSGCSVGAASATMIVWRRLRSSGKTGPKCRPEPVLDVAMVVRSAVVHQRDRDSARRQPVDIPALVPSGPALDFRGPPARPKLS